MFQPKELLQFDYGEEVPEGVCPMTARQQIKRNKDGQVILRRKKGNRCQFPNCEKEGYGGWVDNSYDCCAQDVFLIMCEEHFAWVEGGAR